MEAQEKKWTLTIWPERVYHALIAVEIVLVALSLLSQYVRMYPSLFGAQFPQLAHYFVVEFDVNAEANFPTFYSVSMAIAASFLLFVIAYLKSNVRDKYRFHWFALALLLLYISLDDASVIHEKTSKYIKGFSDLGGWFEYKWVIVGLAVVLILGISFFRFWLHLDNKSKILFLVSGALFFGGAVGVEMIGGHWAYSNGTKNFIYVLFTTLEQSLQYLGIATLVYTLMFYIRSYFSFFSVDMTGFSKNV